jgi:hypothetical protein
MADVDMSDNTDITDVSLIKIKIISYLNSNFIIIKVNWKRRKR